MAQTKGKAVAKKDETSLALNQEAPDYLTGKEKTGTEALGQGDYKIPRIKLLAALSPEIRSFQGKAIPGEFWHTGANKSLTSEFKFIPILVSKRVILWRPRDDNNGGILAFSRDGNKWDTGGDKIFEVILGRDAKTKVKWNTRKSVQQSGLTEFGSSNPANENSAPAATIAYEYLAYLPDHPDLSPVVLGVMRTGVPNARNLNTYLLQQGQAGRPTSCLVIKCFADTVTKGRDVWHVHKFDPAGFAPHAMFKICEALKEQHANYDSDINQDEDGAANVADEKEY